MPRVNSPFRRRLPARVVYAVRPSAQSVGKQLVRTVFDLTVKEAEKSAWEQVVADGLAEVSVEAYVNDAWEARLEASQSQKRTLQAVRLSCRLNDTNGRTSTRTVLLDDRG